MGRTEEGRLPQRVVRGEVSATQGLKRRTAGASGGGYLGLWNAARRVARQIAQKVGRWL